MQLTREKTRVANYLHAETESKLVRPVLRSVSMQALLHEGGVVLARGACTDVAQQQDRVDRARCCVVRCGTLPSVSSTPC